MVTQVVLWAVVLLVVYLLLYSLLPLLFAFLFTGKKVYTKVKVFLLVFGTPILLLLLLLFKGTGNNVFFNVWSVSFLSIVMISMAILTDRKYLTRFDIEGSRLEISYLTPFLQTKSISLDTAGIQTFEIVRSNWLVEFPSVVDIKFEQERLRFELIDKTLMDNLKKQVADVG